MNLNTFYRIWFKDILFYPYDLLKKKNRIKKLIPPKREPIVDKKIYVNIHEWGGYPQKRTKRIKGINTFDCGLLYQLIRFRNQSYKNGIYVSVTISDIDRCNYLDEVKKYSDYISSVENKGLDVSGYAEFFRRISTNPHAYIILTNSSVNKIQYDFLQSYISYMENNPDVGLLGVSASSMYYHTFLRHNFNPHIQSFFILTTISVLKDIIELNGNSFPGINETNKHLLIREGEVKLSALALELGYKLAVVHNGTALKFDYSNYPFPLGDIRRYTKQPNAICPIISIS